MMCSFMRSFSRVLNLHNSARFLCNVAPQPQIPNIAAISKGDEEVERRLKVLVLEVDILRQEGSLVPDDNLIKDSHWEELLKLPSYSSRKRYLEFLFKSAKRDENQRLKKNEKRLEREAKRAEFVKPATYEEFVANHNLGFNNCFLRFYDTTINQFYNNRLIQAIQFGQKLVVDCGFDSAMNNRENVNCAKQLMMLFSENRNHVEPFDLHFCNIVKDKLMIQSLHKHIATMYEKWFPLNLHEQSYMDLFPKQNLVYLTPHCRNEITEYDHEAVYIIGAIVDKSNSEPLSLAKAKREGLKMAKFPLDRYLTWGSGSGKSLTMNQVISILLDVKTTGDWKFALRHVPRRKIAEEAPSRPKFQPPVWRPSTKVDLSNLRYNSKSVKRRFVTVRSLMDDE